MYVMEWGVSNQARAVVIPHAAYDADSLAAQLQSALNGTGKTVAGTYTVTRVVSANADVVTSASATARLYNTTLTNANFWICLLYTSDAADE